MREDNHRERGGSKGVLIIGLVLIFGAILIYLYWDDIAGAVRSGFESVDTQETRDNREAAPVREENPRGASSGRDSYDWGDYDDTERERGRTSSRRDTTAMLTEGEGVESTLITAPEPAGDEPEPANVQAAPEPAPAARGLVLETFTQNSKYGVREQSSGRVVIEPVYNFYVDWDNSMPVTTVALRNHENKYGVVGIDGEVLLPFEFAWIQNTRDANYWIVSRQSGRAGNGVVRKSDGRVVVPFDYDDIRVVGKISFLAAKKNGLWGIINDRNEVILPFQYPDGIGTSISSDGSSATVYFTDAEGNSHGYDSRGNRVYD